MTTRWGRTLADEPELMSELRADALGEFDPGLSTTRVFAPCCGRIVLADCVIDLRGIPGTIIRGGNHRPPCDQDWACDGCVEILYRDKNSGWTRSKLMQARGAPLALVHDVRAMEMGREIDIERTAQKLLHFPVEARQGALAALIVEHRAIAEAEAFGVTE